MQNTGDEWYDTTVSQHIRDLKTFFNADYYQNTKLLFRNMPQAMIDFVTGFCKQKQMQEAYDIWLGSKRKIIQPKKNWNETRKNWKNIKTWKKSISKKKT